jgi:hypothetical protein
MADAYDQEDRQETSHGGDEWQDEEEWLSASQVRFLIVMG